MGALVQYLDGEKEECSNVTRPGRLRVKLSNGDEFVGVYVIGENGTLVKQGEGEYRWKSGATYTGNYQEDVRQGKGKFTYANGAVYEGEYVACKRCGKGREVLSNGDVFAGAFLDDLRHGPGVYTYKSGAVLSGEWDHGEFKEGSWDLGEKHMSTKGIMTALGNAFRQSVNRKSTKRTIPLGVVISGAPASGKGTQCEMIREEFNLVHLSTGDMLRAAVANGTELGRKAKELMESGQLVPDDIVIGAVKERLAQQDVLEHGFLLDGFPRTAAQAKALQEIGVSVDAFIMLNVPDQDLVERVVGRRIDPETGNSYHVRFNPPPAHVAGRLIQRADDTEEKVKVRLQGFHSNIQAIKNFYEHATHHVDGTQKKDKVWQQIQDVIHNVKVSKVAQK